MRVYDSGGGWSGQQPMIETAIDATFAGELFPKTDLTILSILSKSMYVKKYVPTNLVQCSLLHHLVND